MRKFIKLLPVVVFLTVVYAVISVGNSNVRSEDVSAPCGHLQIRSSKEFVTAVLIGKKDNLVFERVRGTCLDGSGHGKVFNDGTDACCYLSYAGVNGVKPGDMVTTYLFYNPENDDIVLRYDRVTGHFEDS